MIDIDNQRMNFYRSFYDLTTLLPERERMKVNTAILDFFFEGTEPSGLNANGQKVFNALAGRISKSRTNAANVANRYSDSKPTKRATKQATKVSTKPATDEPTKPLPDRERERDRDREEEMMGAYDAPPASAPSLEEVRAYFGANCLRGDPDAFFDHYEAQGWLRTNGRKVDSWTAAARQWGRKQVAIDAEKLARGEPTPEQAKWIPASQTEDAKYERAMQEFADVVGEEEARKWREEHED